MARKHYVIALLAFFSGIGAAQAKMLPDNSLYLEDNLKAKGGLTEAQFNAVLDRAEKYFKPIVAAQGGNYHITRLWSDSTVNSDAEQNGTDWNVNSYGGLARRPEITEDGFAMVVCHETGHHLGGFPFFTDQSWAAAVEGQADTFATGACARIVFGDEAANNAAAAAKVDAIPKAKCDAAWSAQADRNLCYRTTMAAKSLATLLAALSGDTADFSTPDQSQVDETNTDHPASQCRLDTYVAAALCRLSWDSSVIPGKVNGVGSNDVSAEQTSAQYYCDGSVQPEAQRPRCWFKPEI